MPLTLCKFAGLIGSRETKSKKSVAVDSKHTKNRRGKSVQHVKDMIQLAEADSDVHQAVNEGHLSGTAALKMVKKHGAQAGAVIRDRVEQAKAEGKDTEQPRRAERCRGVPAPLAAAQVDALLPASGLPGLERIHHLPDREPRRGAHLDDCLLGRQAGGHRQQPDSN